MSIILAWVLGGFAGGGLIAAVGYVLAVPYKKWIEGTLQKSLDAKLETLKSDLRREEDKLKDALTRTTADLNALRDSTLGNLSARHAELTRRRFAAVEKVWAVVVGFGRVKLVSRATETLRLDVAIAIAAKKDADGRRMQLFAENLWKVYGLQDNQTYGTGADAERPFLPPKVWTLFMTYRQVVLYPVVVFAAMRAGSVGAALLKPPDSLVELAKVALPEMVNFIDQHKGDSLPFLVEILEERLLSALLETLQGTGGDEANLAQATNLLAAVRQTALPPPGPLADAPSEIIRVPIAAPILPQHG